MKAIPLRKSYSGLLILVAVIITIVTIGFMFNLYRIYTARSTASPPRFSTYMP